MKKAIILGLIAGFVSGIVSIILKISGFFELFSVTSYLPPVNIQTLIQIEIIWFIVWGIIFGALYAFFYDYVPSEGIKKGLIYGLIIWVIVFLRPASVYASYGFYMWAFPYVITSFFSMVIIYGLVIGYLYKK